MANADCIIIQGSNMAECHPVGFQWVSEAKARGARIIHIDPRFTRTSAIADTHVAIRAGSDVVLLGALIKHVVETDSEQRQDGGSWIPVRMSTKLVSTPSQNNHTEHVPSSRLRVRSGVA